MSPGKIVRRFNFKKTTVYDLKKKDAFVAAGGAPDDFSVTRQPHQERMDAMGDAMGEAFFADVRRMVAGDVMQPFFFPKGLKIYADEYLKVMNDVVKPCVDRVAGGCHYIFQQDGPPAHNAKKTQDWLKENVPEFWGRRSGLPAAQTVTPWTSICGGFWRRTLIEGPTTQWMS